MPRATLLLLSLCCSCITLCYTTGLAMARVPALLVSAAGVLVLLAHLARFCNQQLRMYWMTRHLPGPSPTLPLLGNALEVYGVPQEDFMDFVMDLWQRLGPTFRVWAGPILVIFCCEPHDLQAIFSHQNLQKKSTMYGVLKSVAGNGLLTLGSSHQRHSKAITPSFHTDIIKSFIPAFALQGRNLTNAMKHFSESGETFNVLQLTERAVSHAVCETMLGSVSKESMATIGKDMREGTKLMMFVAMRPWFGKSDFCFQLLAPSIFKERQRLYDELDGVVRCALDFKEKQLKGEKPLNGGEWLDGDDPHGKEWKKNSSKAKELVEHILTSKEGALINREELVNDLKHLLIGATVSTSDLLALLMLSLATTPDVQDKVHQELDEVFADDPSRPVRAADLPRLRYLEMTMKEVMRYFPLIPIYARNASDDVTLPSGAVVPRGSTVAIFPKAVHWDPRWYADPSAFNPDRFRPEVANTRPNFTFIPFSAGARGCIGQRYETAISKTMAATVLREYRFLPSPGGVQRLCDLKLVIGIAMHLHGGVNIRVEKRLGPS